MRLYLIAEYGPLCRDITYLLICGDCQKEVAKRRKSDEHCKELFKGRPVAGALLLEHCGAYFCRKCRILCKKALHIKGGFKGASLLSEFQMHQLCKEEEISDLMEAYHRKNQLSYEEQTQFLSQIGREKDISVHNYTKDELTDLFESVPKDEDGQMDYYECRAFIRELRQQGIDNFRRMYPQLATRKGSNKHVVPSGARPMDVNLMDSNTFGTDARGVYATRLLARKAAVATHQIANLADKNKPELVQNVALLRQLPRVAPSHDWKR